MPQHWKTYKLGDLIKIKHGYAFKGDFFTIIKNENVLLTPGNFQPSGGIKFNWEKQKFYEGEFPHDYILKENDLILALTDLTQSCDILGSPAIIKDSNYNYLHNQRLGLVNIISEEIDKIFLFYYFNHPNFRNRIIATKTGSTVSHTAPERIYECELSLPPLPEQRAIASILSALDDKIELNLQMNKTLEEMAMALYKHWFVDFGPFKDGKFVESELGMIPEGWEVKRFFDLFELLSGGTPKTTVDEYWNGDVCWVSAKDIGNGGIFIDSTEKQITQLGIEKSATKMLPADTVIVVARGSVGKFGMIATPMTMNQSCYGIFSKSTYSQPLVYLLTGSLISHFQSVAYGSVFDTITTSTFQNINVLLPDNESMELIRKQIEPLFDKIKENTLENSVLKEKRDSLLPKLISGEVAIKSEHHVE